MSDYASSLTLENLATLEAQLVCAKAAAHSARDRVREASLALDAYDSRVGRLRAKRKAAEESILITLRATRASGLPAAVASAAVARNEVRKREATLAIRAIISDAASACAEFDAALHQYQACRALERTILAELLTKIPAVPQREPRRDLIKQQLAEHDARTEREKLALRNVAEPAYGDEHFDPQYDSWELLQRKRRPWV